MGRRGSAGALPVGASTSSVAIHRLDAASGLPLATDGGTSAYPPGGLALIDVADGGGVLTARGAEDSGTIYEPAFTLAWLRP